MTGSKTRGLLVPIGGGYTDGCMRAFARVCTAKAGSSASTILVVPAAFAGESVSDNDYRQAEQRTVEVGAVARDTFRGAVQAKLVPIFGRDDAFDTANAAPFESPDVAGIFFLGGDQDFAMQVLAESPAEKAMACAFERGVVVGGTSAGAMMQSRSMIAGYSPYGSADTDLQEGSVDVRWSDANHGGLSFGSESVIIDSHFFERSRFGRLLSVVARSADRFGNGGCVGVGIDRAGGMVTRADVCVQDVFGRSSLAVVDFRSAGTTHGWIRPVGCLSARNILTHLVAPGDGTSYDIERRLPIREGMRMDFRRSSEPLPLVPKVSALILCGNACADPALLGLRAFVDAAVEARTERLVIAPVGHHSICESLDARYASPLRRAGWTGSITEIEFVPGRRLKEAAVLLAGTQESGPAGLGDGDDVCSAVVEQLRTASIILADGIAAATVGGRYVCRHQQELNQSAVEGVRRLPDRLLRPGIAIAPHVAIEPALDSPGGWARLYNLSAADPSSVVLGLSGSSVLVLRPTGGKVLGGRPVIALDGRSAAWGTGSAGQLAAYNVIMHVFAPGDRIAI
ncbi:MAG: hypothetical protein ACRDFS_08010 [Chloroflexota bacterium]